MRFPSILIYVILVFSTVDTRYINFHYNKRSISFYNIIKNKRHIIDFVNTSGFEYEVHCLDDYMNMCDAVKTELVNALENISNAIELYKPITFKAYVYNDPEDDTVAYVTDINFVPLRTSNSTSTPPYLYAQALAKQLNLNIEYDFKKDDFIIVINLPEKSDELAKINNNLKIKENIVHELMHGLGVAINNSLIHLKDNGKLEYFDGIVNDDIKDDIKFLPNPFIHYDTKRINNASSIDDLNTVRKDGTMVLSPLTNYEHLLVDMETREPIFEDLGYLYNEFNCLTDEISLGKNVQYSEFSKCYNQLSEETKKNISKVVDYYLKYKSIGILNNKGTVIPVQTFDDIFFIGSSIEHTNAIYLNEFYDGIRTNFTLKQLYLNGKYDINDYSEIVSDDNIYGNVDENYVLTYLDLNISTEHFLKTVGKDNKYGLIGNGMLDILTALGWTEKGEKKNDNIYYVAEDIDFPNQNEFSITVKELELKSLEETTEAITNNDEELDDNIIINEESSNSEKESSDDSIIDNDENFNEKGNITSETEN